jgi:hypothetical protein
MLVKGDINLQYDQKIREYYVIWEPAIIGMGKTESEALEDLRTASHVYTDALIDLKIEDITIIKED